MACRMPLSGTADHVHLVAAVPPSMPLSTFIAQIKGGSSHLASHISGDAAEAFAWQAEYGVLSISEAHLPLVVRYVELQQQHHASNRLNRTLESWADDPQRP